jgi:excisionase family DNA binding protein
VAEVRLGDTELEPVAVLRVPALLSVATTARLLDCSPRTVRRRIAERSLPAVIDHGRILIRADELREYIDRLERVGASRSPRPQRAGRTYDFLRE